jgi:hypothetical protein
LLRDDRWPGRKIMSRAGPLIGCAFLFLFAPATATQESQTSLAQRGRDIGGIGPVPEGYVAWVVAMVVLMIVIVLIGRSSERETGA